jgi:hypothetical protein
MDSSPPPPNDAPFTRFSALVKRELGAGDVRILEPPAEPPLAPNVLSAPLLGGRHVVVTLGDSPDNPTALARRLEILARTFAHALEESATGEHPAHRPSRPPIAMSLHDELRALTQRSRAIDAVVLDAHSPVVWGSATIRTPRRQAQSIEEMSDALERLEESRRALFQVIRELSPEAVAAQDVTAPDVPPPTPSSDVLVSDQDDDEEMPEATVRALREVRELPGIAALRRGRPLVFVVREETFGYVARSFAGIYLVVLVYDAPFDELRAERVLIEALPKVERLVLALPPIDPGPAPTANVIAIRRRRR